MSEKDDGVALTSASHPVPADISPDALQDVEIEISQAYFEARAAKYESLAAEIETNSEWFHNDSIDDSDLVDALRFAARKLRETEVAFKATPKTMELLKGFGPEVSDETLAEFFSLWETEDSPRRAGSIMAHRHISIAARLAIFGSLCAREEPNLDLFMGACRDNFDAVIANCEEIEAALAEAETEIAVRDGGEPQS